MVVPSTLPLEPALAALNAAGEETRLRLLALLAEAELTVSEIVAILGQSQPRVSRHLKLLVEAGVIERHREGAWAFFRLASMGATGGGLRAASSTGSTPATRVLAGDRARLDEVAPGAGRQRRALFRLARRRVERHPLATMCPRSEVEAAIREAIGDAPIRLLLDLGAGAGRMLELFAPRAERAIGVDLSSAMLASPAAAWRKAARETCNCARAIFTRCRSSATSRSRDHASGAALSRRSRPRHARGGAGARAGRAADRRRFRARMSEEALREEHAHRRLGFSAARKSPIC